MKKLFLSILIILLFALAACGGGAQEAAQGALESAQDAAQEGLDAAQDAAQEGLETAQDAAQEGLETAQDAIEDATNGDSESMEEGAAGDDVALCDTDNIPQATQADVMLRFVNNTDGDVEIIWRDLRRSTPVLTQYTVLAAGETHDQQTFVGHEWIAEDQAGNGVVEYTATADNTQCLIVETADMAVVPVDEEAVETFVVDPTEPIEVEDNDGTQVSIEANTLVDENGNPPAGDVSVNVHTPDPMDEAEAAAVCEEPALIVWSYNEETGLWEEEGAAPVEGNSCVESVGAVAVDVTDEGGNDLDLGEGKTAEVTIPCEPEPEVVLSTASYTVWSYDVETGLWIEEPFEVEVKEEEKTCTADVSNPSNVVFGTKEAEAPGTITGTLVNALNNNPLDSAQVCLQSSGACVSVDSSGNYTFADVPAGEQIVTATSAGYFESSQTVLVEAQMSANGSFALSPELTGDTIRIVLTWGADVTNFDAVLWTPKENGEGDRGLYYWGSRGSELTYPYVVLDTDNQGSLGPETITIYTQISDVYSFQVTDNGGSRNFETVRIEVYSSAGLVDEFNGPATNENRYQFWHVFDYDGATGQITEVNELLSREQVLSSHR